ncbi:MAG: MATE family efflux transporter [Lachnospiraceae bacterium]|nr:MATE family efflux transporter [Lachnospiraceae bacterium]
MFKRHNNIDFSKGPVWKCIISQAIPLTVAQFVQLLYNVIDRIYLGHMGEGHSLALTGVGLTFPVITLIMAFTALFGHGGIPLFSIERGRGNKERAGRILGNSFALLSVSGMILMLLCFIFSKPVLYAFGASDTSFVYAQRYLRIYLFGTLFSMIATGLNGYISAQGYPGTGMLSTVIGAVLNMLLDPLFIFGFKLGVSGAALATVISQIISAIWVMRFLIRRDIPVPLIKENVKLDKRITIDICRLGASNFIMQGTNFAVQVVCNSTLSVYGGDLYVGIMTVTNSVREIFILPINGIISGAQPVISYNYGAKDYKRARAGINFNTVLGVVYTMFAWLAVIAFPHFFFALFSEDILLLDAGIDALKIYFFGFVFMALQFAGQSSFQALGDAKHAIFFSLLRKAFIVVPLTLILPAAGFGVKGVFLAEPVSNVIGGLACFITMRLTAYKKLK